MQIWGLPFEFVTPVIWEIIGKRLGDLIMVDDRINTVEMGRFIRVRVCIPLDKPLKKGGNVVVGNGVKVRVEYKYERLNSFYQYCGFLRHEEAKCELKESHVQNRTVKDCNFGDSLRPGGGFFRSHGPGRTYEGVKMGVKVKQNDAIALLSNRRLVGEHRNQFG